MKKIIVILVVCLTLAGCSVEAPKENSSNTYSQKVKGYIGEFTVDVVINDGVIEAVNVGENSETPEFGGKAIEKLSELFVREQVANVDIHSGATVTSEALVEAVTNAITEAGLNIEDYTKNDDVSKVKKENEEVDVLVVGAGLAGLMTAYELKAIDENITVTVVEKLPVIGGSSVYTSGAIFTTNSSIHKETNAVTSTSQELVTWIEEITKEDMNDEVINAVYGIADETIQVLMDKGAKFTGKVGVTTPLYPNLTNLRFEDGGAGLLSFLENLVETNPIDLRLETEVVSLLQDNGTVVGASVEDTEGTYNINADVVVLATGGIGSNKELMEKYAPEYASGFMFTNGGAKGDGILLTETLNANVLGYGTMGALVASDKKALYPSTFYVNSSGERFMNEKHPGPITQRMVAEQEGQIAYAIADSSSEDLSAYEKAVTNNTASKYETIEELAKGINVDVTTLTNEINGYNEAISNDTEIEFALANAAAMPILKAPFYAQKAHIRVNGTFVGLEINDQTQVINASGNVINGLLACGELVVGNAYSRLTPGGGYGLAFAANSGRLTAEVASTLVVK